MRQNPSIPRSCEQCGTVFFTFPCRIREGVDRFCSRACNSEHRRATFPDRLFSKIDTSGECHLWTANKDRDGYGRVRRGMENIHATRAVWELANGPIPPGLHVCHRCDNPPCVRLEHLWLGSDADNSRDMAAKGRGAIGDKNGSRKHPERYPRGAESFPTRHPERYPHGERHPKARFTDDQVRDIRRRYTGARGESQALARELGCAHETIRMIVSGKTWRHLLPSP